MPSNAPTPGKVKTFRIEAAFESWMRKNHEREREVWLPIDTFPSDAFRTTNIKTPLNVPEKSPHWSICWNAVTRLTRSVRGCERVRTEVRMPL